MIQEPVAPHPNSSSAPFPSSRLRGWEWVALALILSAAFVLRGTGALGRLDEIPPGLTHDEAGHGHDAIAILHGARPIYETVGYGREPLYDYVVAGMMTLGDAVGASRVGVLRFSSVPFSLLTLLATFAWVRLAFDRPTALAATAFQAASFWSLTVSRQALRSGLLPALFTAAVYFYWSSASEALAPSSIGSQRRSVQRRVGIVALVCTSVLIGATLYTYIPARVLWVIFPAFLLYLLLTRREAFQRLWLPTLSAILVALLLAMPLFAYLRAHPGAEERLAMLNAPLQALRNGDPSVILRLAGDYVAGLFIPGRGDDFLAYTLPGRPVFDPFTGTLFLIGVGFCLARWRKPACAFALIWFLVAISPSLITGPSASITRTIAALPVFYLFPALAVVTGARWAWSHWGAWAGWAVTLMCVALILVTGALVAHDYFVKWGESPEVRAAYQHTLVESARYLDARPGERIVGLSTLQPYAPHDPYVFQMSLQRGDLSTHWFDARRALLLPSGADATPASSASLIAPASAPVASYFTALPGLRFQERVSMRPDDLDPYFDVYAWEPQVTWDALREQMQEAPLSVSGDTGSELSPPVNFADALQFLGYDLRTPTVAPGGRIEAVTLWRVLDPRSLRPEDLADVDAELVLFTHALDATGAVVGQEDRLDAPAWDWQRGDVIAQIHSFPLPVDLSADTVLLEVGLYRRSGNMGRLPVLVDGVGVGDHIFLQPVKVASQ